VKTPWFVWLITVIIIGGSILCILALRPTASNIWIRSHAVKFETHEQRIARYRQEIARYRQEDAESDARQEAYDHNYEILRQYWTDKCLDKPQTTICAKPPVYIPRHRLCLYEEPQR
jgi:hypothetical protein